MLKVGDKVRISPNAVAENGMCDTENQEKEYVYICDHENDVYEITDIDVPAEATIRLDCPALVDTSFYEDELIPVNDDNAENNAAQNQVLRFYFADTDDGGSMDVEILAMVSRMTTTKEAIEDAIASYIDSVEGWQYEELVNDVLKSFELDYTIINPVTFNI